MAEKQDSSSNSSINTTPQSQLIKLTVKMSGDKKFSVEVPTNMNVAEFKKALVEGSGVAANLQRLIYAGTVLKDDKSLDFYKLANGHALHLVQGAPPQQRAPGGASQHPQAHPAHSRAPNGGASFPMNMNGATVQVTAMGIPMGAQGQPGMPFPFFFPQMQANPNAPSNAVGANNPSNTNNLNSPGIVPMPVPMPMFFPQMQPIPQGANGGVSNQPQANLPQGGAAPFPFPFFFPPFAAPIQPGAAGQTPAATPQGDGANAPAAPPTAPAHPQPHQAPQVFVYVNGAQIPMQGMANGPGGGFAHLPMPIASGPVQSGQSAVPANLTTPTSAPPGEVSSTETNVASAPLPGANAAPTNPPGAAAGGDAGAHPAGFAFNGQMPVGVDFGTAIQQMMQTIINPIMQQAMMQQQNGGAGEFPGGAAGPEAGAAAAVPPPSPTASNLSPSGADLLSPSTSDGSSASPATPASLNPPAPAGPFPQFNNANMRPPGRMFRVQMNPAQFQQMMMNPQMFRGMFVPQQAAPGGGGSTTPESTNPQGNQMPSANPHNQAAPSLSSTSPVQGPPPSEPAVVVATPSAGGSEGVSQSTFSPSPAAFVSGSPSVNVDSRNNILESQIARLNEMGFFDRNECLQALTMANGNVNLAVEILLSR